MDRLKTITDVIKSRRSIFPPMYTGEKVDDSVIWEILENARWAPNHRNTEPWRFVVIPQEKIPELCAFGSKWYKEYTPKELFSEIKYKKIQTKPLPSSHIIAICMQRDEDKRVPKWEEKAAIACAVQNIYLTVSAMGLGGYWSTPAYALAADEFLGLQARQRCLGLFYIGVPKADLKLEGKRQTLESKVRWL